MSSHVDTCTCSIALYQCPHIQLTSTLSQQHGGSSTFHMLWGELSTLQLIFFHFSYFLVSIFSCQLNLVKYIFFWESLGHMLHRLSLQLYKQYSEYDRSSSAR